MLSETFHLPDTQSPLILFRMVVIKSLTVLLSIVISLPACLLKKTTSPAGEEKRCITSKAESTDNPLKSLLTHLRLTDSDLKLELPKKDQDYFRL
ncbi:MAG: hypothetical protein V3V90_01500, partial [Thermodesulfobacteriota bacterium]